VPPHLVVHLVVPDQAVDAEGDDEEKDGQAGSADLADCCAWVALVGSCRVGLAVYRRHGHELLLEPILDARREWRFLERCSWRPGMPSCRRRLRVVRQGRLTHR
jgi:hypothetical protein